MKYRKITDFDKHISNPFVDKAIEDIKVVKRTQVVRSNDNNDIQLIKDVKTGEINGHSAFMRFIEVDEEKFAKVYLSQFAAFWELSKPAIRVFGYILSVLKPNQDNFIFELDTCIEHTKYKQKAMVFTGLANLMECGIIARTRYDHKYYINPLIVFNGNRVTFAKTYVKKKKHSDPNPNQIKIFNETTAPEKNSGMKTTELLNNQYLVEYDEDRSSATITNLNPEPEKELKRVEPNDNDKQPDNWSNFSGNPDKPTDFDEERIKKIIEKVLKGKW